MIRRQAILKRGKSQNEIRTTIDEYSIHDEDPGYRLARRWPFGSVGSTKLDEACSNRFTAT